MRWEPLFVVLGLIALGMVLIAASHPRAASYLIGLAMLVGAGLRAALPASAAGLLVVRSRVFDVTFMTTTGVGVVVFAFLDVRS